MQQVITGRYCKSRMRLGLVMIDITSKDTESNDLWSLKRFPKVAFSGSAPSFTSWVCFNDIPSLLSTRSSGFSDDETINLLL